MVKAPPVSYQRLFTATSVPATDPLGRARPGLVGPNWFPGVAGGHSRDVPASRVLLRIVAASVPRGPDVFDGFTGCHLVVFLSSEHHPPARTPVWAVARTPILRRSPKLLVQDRLGGLQVQHGDASIARRRRIVTDASHGAWRRARPSTAWWRPSPAFCFNGITDHRIVPLDGMRADDGKITPMRKHTQRGRPLHVMTTSLKKEEAYGGGLR
ncbi:uncharacterized protein THITE_2129349 [Thermothielavioides terrestris NRRL 8126]|uniref:Uncharacterized protein n=1 Tax=Thermothielavioides terrestris (strain ATCC 38088 / NRRL 8126) TaxID=578455 RepID=G2R5F9_THETT|nr:uncharacterized protein THITE_2129349 [Thermothielavioides terrestris NRRL 8126]AEO67450.1 hypothetical protein THITE_2129349 [Thermothielavioides terrestris NRRL 8126]